MKSNRFLRQDFDKALERLQSFCNKEDPQYGWKIRDLQGYVKRLQDWQADSCEERKWWEQECNEVKDQLEKLEDDYYCLSKDYDELIETNNQLKNKWSQLSKKVKKFIDELKELQDV